MGVLYTHPHKKPRPLPHARASKNFFLKKNKKNKFKWADLTAQGHATVAGGLPLGRLPLAANQQSLAGHGVGPWVVRLPPPPPFPPCPIFFLCGQPSHWLQHMPALARPCPKTSNTHNFWSVGPKIMKFVLTRSLQRDAFSQKVSKKL
jgi:hypothetical protein